jgi:tetratricopeptide (TPR) repeat protein
MDFLVGEMTSTAMPTKATKNRNRLVVLLCAVVVLFAIAVIVNLGYLRDRKSQRFVDEGIAHFQAKRLAEAAQAWRSALVADPDNLTACRLLSDLYMESGEFEQAVPLLERLYSRTPRTPHVACRLSEAYNYLGRNDRSLEIARRAVAFEPDCSRAHALLGIQLGNQNNTTESLKALAKAYQLEPTNDKIALSYAQAQLAAIDLDGAEKTIRKVIERNSRSAMAHYLLGWTYRRRSPTPENVQSAIDAFEKAVQLDPTRKDAFIELGKLYTQTKRYQEARVVLESLWQSPPRSPQVAFTLAQVYRALKMPAQAEQFTQAFKQLNEEQEEFNALRKRLQTEPSNIDVPVRLAELSLKRGDVQEASVLLREALRRNPDHPRAAELAVKLRQMAPSVKPFPQ